MLATAENLGSYHINQPLSMKSRENFILIEKNIKYFKK